MKPALALSRPSAVNSDAARAASKLAGDARIVVDVHESLHRALKVRAASRGVSIKAYVLQLLAADGVADV